MMLRIIASEYPCLASNSGLQKKESVLRRMIREHPRELVLKQLCDKELLSLLIAATMATLCHIALYR